MPVLVVFFLLATGPFMQRADAASGPDGSGSGPQDELHRLPTGQPTAQFLLAPTENGESDSLASYAAACCMLEPGSTRPTRQRSDQFSSCPLRQSPPYQGLDLCGPLYLSVG